MNYNLIEECGRDRISIFDMISSTLFTFEHNIIKNCYSSDYLCSIDFNITQNFIINNLSVIGCESNGEHSGGFGIWIRLYNRMVTYMNCIFENNEVGGRNGNGGAISVGYGTNGFTKYTFKDCLFKENKASQNGGALSIQSSEPVLIENCNFTNNLAGKIETSSSKYGGAIYFDPNANYNQIKFIDIKNCIFKSNHANGNKGHSICITGGKTTTVNITDNCKFIDEGANIKHEGYVIYSKVNYLEITDCDVIFSDEKSSSSGFFLSGTGSTTIKNVYFLYVFAFGIEDNTIKIEKDVKSVNVENCRFNSCFFHGMKYIIWDEGKLTKINNCSFYLELLETPPSEFAGSVYKVNSFGVHSFTNCNISNSTTNKGCISYKPTINFGLNNEYFTFQNVIFDTLYGTDSIAFDIDFSNGSYLFDHITIKNAQNGNSLFSINILGELEELIFDNFCFINNLISGNIYGGCLGIYSGSKKVSIELKNCLFENNNHKTNGGALQFGNGSSISYAKLTMTNCTFFKNIADSDGGALFIQIYYPVLIEKCVFIENQAKNCATYQHFFQCLYQAKNCVCKKEQSYSKTVILLMEWH